MNKNSPTTLRPSLKASEDTVKLRRASSLTTLLCIAFACNIYTMEPEQPNKNWLALVTDSLLSGIKPRKQSFLRSPKFEDLPPEEQAETILFLRKNDTAPDLDTAANAINALEKINKQLDTLINNPTICLQLIKRLTQRFDCSDETAAKALQTKEANKRLIIQKKFEMLFSESHYFETHAYTEKKEKKTEKKKTLYDFNIHEFQELYDQYKDYLDVNFTYKNFQDPRYDDKDTLLINSVMYPSPYKATKIESLLETHKVNVNYQNALKETALMKGATNCDNPVALKLLCDDPNIQIDLQDQNNNTALMRACLIKVSPQKEVREKSHKAICISLLLRAGADPEKVNSYGQTPLTILKNMGDNETEIKLIQDAIQKKHAPRIGVTKTKKSTKQKKIISTK